MAASRLAFDCVLKAEHSSTLTITEHPVESGGNITDHSRLDPQELILELGATDAGTYNGRSVQAFQSLKAMQASGIPLTVVTRLQTYTNMLIASLSAPEDYTTMHAVKATATFREIRIVSTATVGVQGRSGEPQKTGSTSGGTKQAAPVDNSATKNQSVLAGLRDTVKNLLQ